MRDVSDISQASRLIFPGVGAYGQAMERLKQLGYVEALKDYIQVIPSLLQIIVTLLDMTLTTDAATLATAVSLPGINHAAARSMIA